MDTPRNLRIANGLLTTVNLSTGELTMIGALPAGSESLAFLNSSEVLVLTTPGALYDVDPLTASYSLIGDLPAGASMVGGTGNIRFDPQNGMLYETSYSADSELFVVSPSNASATLIGSTTLTDITLGTFAGGLFYGSSQALVRYETNDYSVPTEYGHQQVLVKAFVWEVVIGYSSEVIARHPRSYGREEMIFNPLHYLALLEQKTNALDQAAPLQALHVPEEMKELRRQMEQRRGVREHHGGNSRWPNRIRCWNRRLRFRHHHATGVGCGLRALRRRRCRHNSGNRRESREWILLCRGYDVRYLWLHHHAITFRPEFFRLDD